MTREGPRRIKSIALQIAMPADLSAEQLKVLQAATKDCPVLRNLEGSMEIIVNWKRTKSSGQTLLKFLPTKVFRETPKVTFFEAGVAGSNGSDVVIHKGRAISPPNDDDYEQYYVHKHQIDHNLVLSGKRIFTLLNPEWDEPHHVIYLTKKWVRYKSLLALITDQSQDRKAASSLIKQCVMRTSILLKNLFL